MNEFKGRTKAWLRTYIASQEAELARLHAEIEGTEHALEHARIALATRRSTAELRFETIRDNAAELTRRHGDFTYRQLARISDISRNSAANYVRRMMQNVPPLVELTRISDESGRQMHYYRYVKPKGSSPARERKPQPEVETSRPQKYSGPISGISHFSSSDARVTAMLDQAQKQGAKVTGSGGKYKVKYRGQSRSVAKTPGDNRTYLNDRARLRQMGLDV